MYRGSVTQERIIRTALIAVLSLTVSSLIHPQELAAAGLSSVIQVNAIVLPHVSVNVLSQPAELVVTEMDIQRGFIEIAASSLVEVISNVPAGCLLSFSTHGLPFREASVKGLGTDIVLRPAGGWIHLRVKGRLVATLGYRFVLAKGASPGTYAWPISLTADPF